MYRIATLFFTAVLGGAALVAMERAPSLINVAGESPVCRSEFVAVSRMDGRCGAGVGREEFDHLGAAVVDQVGWPATILGVPLECHVFLMGLAGLILVGSRGHPLHRIGVAR